MKFLSILKIWGLRALVIGISAAIGSTFLEAKKPQPQKWEVSIVDIGDCNLFCTTANLQEDSGNIFVRVNKEKDRGAYLYRLRLWIENTDQTQSIKIGFVNLMLTELTNYSPTGVPCVFPVDCCGGDIPCCMQCFLNGFLHPYSSTDCDARFPNCDYSHIDLEITVACDIEQIGRELSNPHYTSGNVRLMIHNTSDLLKTGYEDFHNISCRREFDGNLRVEALGDNTWVVGVDDYLEVREHYYGRFKGNSYENKFPIRTEAPFKFITQWKRID